MTDNLASLPFKEAIDFFRKERKLPTASWTDIWQEQHSHAFVVAGANTDALVEDFYNAMQEAKTTGGGYADFRNQFDGIVKKHGWAYNGGAGWRSKVIYDTNITQSYNAGRYVQMMEVKHLRPFWEYQHTSIEHPRLSHLSWDGLILPADDAWFNTHMPQNGWGCKCRVISHSRTGAKNRWEAQGKAGVDTAPEIIYEDRVVGKNGSNPRTVSTPQGIDPGFGYNPGKAYVDNFSPHPTGYEASFAKNLNKSGNYIRLPNNESVLPPTQINTDWLNDRRISGEAGVIGFLDIFGADLTTSKVIIDKADTPLTISKALFIKGDDKESNQFKWLEDPDKLQRIEYLNLLAMAIADPDEIWWQWERDRGEKGKWRLFRRYLKSYQIDGVTKYAVSSFRWNYKVGWEGATTFIADTKDPAEYFAKQRLGRLVYKRKN